MNNDFWRRAEKLFHAALERTPQSRDAFLDEACGKDAGLRRHVELLIRYDKDSSLLEHSVFADLVKGRGRDRWSSGGPAEESRRRRVFGALSKVNAKRVNEWQYGFRPPPLVLRCSSGRGPLYGLGLLLFSRTKLATTRQLS